jgi:2-oxoglutarate dehydrogenase E1 component
MPHRGRLNILSNVIRKPNESIFCEFMGVQGSTVEGSGDVKYHLGMNYVRPTPSGKKVHLSLIANPAHLEAVGPVVLGKTKALQFYSNDAEHDNALSIILHGDAAFAAQGVVYESMSFHDTPAYTTGGSIHVVINNQIGFTTDPRYARSTPYCTDIAKSINSPILHVNADDVEAVTFVMQLAADWRKTFKKDIVVDLVCYRRHGHNEADQPSFTQPAMYERIAKQKPVLDQYIDQLKKEGVFTDKDIEDNKARIQNLLEESYSRSKNYNPTSREWLSSSWPGKLSILLHVTPILNIPD